MIIWLASYPRSGNTLLRTILKLTMNLDQFSDDPEDPDSDRVGAAIMRRIGGVPLSKPWPEFYNEARVSAKTFYIKTHAPPHDDSPAIYVVRDGRSSVVSYFQYHRRFFPEAGRTLWQIIHGDDICGDWSGHFNSWNESPSGPRLLLRFEDLVECSHDLLEKIAGFIGFCGTIQPWVNPREELSRIVPDFVRKGEARWVRPEFWDDQIDTAFFALHGPLMEKLVYGMGSPEADALSLHAQDINRLALEKWALQRSCEQKEAAIQQLAAATNKMRQSCGEKEAVIQELSAALQTANKTARDIPSKYPMEKSQVRR